VNDVLCYGAAMIDYSVLAVKSCNGQETSPAANLGYGIMSLLVWLKCRGYGGMGFPDFANNVPSPDSFLA